jgi:hypothetical protein
MRGSRIILFVACLAAALALPAAAGAQTIPEDAAFDQYLEGTPNPRGESRPEEEGVPLPRDSRQALEALGPVGEQAAALAERTSERRRPRPETEDVGGGLGTVLDAVSWSFGLLLLLILAVTALLAAALHAARRRTATPEPGA